MAIPYKRDPEYVIKHLHAQEDGSVITDTACKIIIPERYASRNLANISTEVYILAFFALIMDEKVYSVSRTCSMIRIEPSSIEKVEMQGMVFLEFSFLPGDRVFHATDLVMSKTLTYYVYDEHVAKGNIPWYFNYFDMASMFSTAKEFTGVHLGNRAVLELILSTMARDPSDYSRLYRHVITNDKDLQTQPPGVVPFRSVIWNVTDTTSKFIGSHFGDVVLSAVVNPSDQTERIEQLLRA